MIYLDNSMTRKLGFPAYDTQYYEMAFCLVPFIFPPQHTNIKLGIKH